MSVATRCLTKAPRPQRGSGFYAGQNGKCAPTATRTRDLPLRRSPVTVEIYLDSRTHQPTLPADISYGAHHVTSATVPSYAGECRFVRGFSVGAAAGIPELWGICGENRGASPGLLTEAWHRSRSARDCPQERWAPWQTTFFSGGLRRRRAARRRRPTRRTADRAGLAAARQAGATRPTPRLPPQSLEITELDLRHYGPTAIVRCALRSVGAIEFSTF